LNLIGLLPARNEDWVLGLSARVALQWCDALVILDHASGDATGDIIDALQNEHPHRVRDLYADGEWDEMRHRQRMLEEARRFGATHIALIDADEILTATLLGAIRANIERLTSGTMLSLPGHNMRGGIQRYHSNGLWGNRWFSVACKDDPALSWCGDQFHHREPFGCTWRQSRPFSHGMGGVMHLWAADERRCQAKHALYKLTERLRFPDKPVAEIDAQYNMWRSRVDAARLHPTLETGGEWQYKNVPLAWLAKYQALGWLKHLHLDREPWQESGVRRLVQEHGAEVFAGLDLFGVDKC